MKPIEAETCVDAWLQACDYLLGQPAWRGYSLVLEITNPMALPAGDRASYDLVDAFLIEKGGLPVNTVVNTIFPARHYLRHGANGLYDCYINEIYPGISQHPDFSWGTYFFRLVQREDRNGKKIYPLNDLVDKLKSQLAQSGPNRAVYELSSFDLFLDIPIYDPGSDRKRPLGGPCLTHLSFAIGTNKNLLLTAFYRSHFYVQRALGNLFGLAHLQNFVAEQTGLVVGPLVCISSMAQLDISSGQWGKNDVKNLISACHKARNDALGNEPQQRAV